MNGDMAKKFGEILGKIGCLDSNLVASKKTIECLKKSSLEASSEKWFDEAIERNAEIEKLVDELWNMAQAEDEERLNL